MTEEARTVSFSVLLDMTPTYNELRKVEAIVFKVMNLLKKFGLGESVDTVIAGVQKMVMAVRMLQMTVRAFMVAAGPIGWIYAGVTAIATVATLVDMG
jgi:uncharacterized protein YaaW (UPF0174 family)